MVDQQQPKAPAPQRALSHFLRYLLAIGMLPYAISKLQLIQFQVAPTQYSRPVGDLSTTTLTWLFLGHTPWLQFLLGVAEFIPAILLLANRTRILGALLMLPATATVFITNIAYDLWPTTKVISLTFLLINVTLLAIEFRVLKKILSVLWVPPSNPSPWRFWSSTVAGFAIVAGIYFFHSSESKLLGNEVQPFIGTRQINRRGAWLIEKATFNGKAIDNPGVLHLDVWRRCILEAPHNRTIGQFKIDGSKSQVEMDCLPEYFSAKPFIASYTIQGDKLLLKSASTELRLKPHNWGPGLLSDKQ
jgi:hypothetical protein